MSSVFVTADGDSVGQLVGRLRLANDVDGLRRVNQGIDRGNEVFEAWALSHGGSVVEAGGDEITIELPAQYLDELPGQRRLYAERVGSTVSVGVGFKLAESAKALLAAKLRGKDKIVFYVPGIEAELAEAEKRRPDEAGKLVQEYLAPVSKAETQYCAACRDPLDKDGHCKVKSHWPILDGLKKDEQPGYHKPGAAAKPAAGQPEHSEAQVAREQAAEAPPTEHTHASSDFEEVLKELQGHADKGDAEAEKTGGEAKAREEAAKQEAAKALVKMKKVMPVLEQLRNVSPEAYDAVGGLARAMVELGRAAGYGQAFDTFDNGGSNVQNTGQLTRAETPSLPFDELAKADRTTPHGFVDPQGNVHDIDEEDHHDWIARQMGMDDPNDAYDEAMKRGWMGYGVGHEHNVQAWADHIRNPNHPATKAIRAIAKRHWGPEFELYAHDPSGFLGAEGQGTKHDTRAFVGRGALTPPSPFRKAEVDARYEELVKDEPARLTAKNWPKRVDDTDVFRYVRDLHTGGRGDLNLSGLPYGTELELRDLPLKRLPALRKPTDALVGRYAAMKTPFPPVVIGPGGRVLDGHTRIAAARARGDVSIKAYVPLAKAEPGRPSDVERLAAEYAAEAGIPYREPAVHSTNEGLLRRVAEAYEGLKHDPDDPEVKAAYDALKRETLAQYDFLKRNGYRFSPRGAAMTPASFEGGNAGDTFVHQEGAPYGSHRDMADDVKNNRHLYVFTGGDIPSDHPLAAPTPGNDPLPTYNDVFRAVHDVFGHVKSGADFGHHGEDQTWHHHVPMYSPLAQRALTTETRGQNTAFHYGKHGEHNRANPAEAVYPEQKAGLMPPEFSAHPSNEVGKAELDARFAELEKAEGGNPVLGTTSTGKPVYGFSPEEAAVWAKERAAGGMLDDRVDAHLERHASNFSPDEHGEAREILKRSSLPHLGGSDDRQHDPLHQLNYYASVEHGAWATGWARERDRGVRGSRAPLRQPAAPVSLPAPSLNPVSRPTLEDPEEWDKTRARTRNLELAERDPVEIEPDPRLEGGGGQIVYRVQNKHGRGPYHAEGNVLDFAAEHEDSPPRDSAHGSLRMDVIRRQPGPVYPDLTEPEFKNRHFIGNPDRARLRFGFQSPEHAREWFGTSALEEMAREGYGLVPVRAQRVWPSRTRRQVVFLPHESETLGKVEGDAWDEKAGKLRDWRRGGKVEDDPAAPRQHDARLCKGSTEPNHLDACIYCRGSQPRNRAQRKRLKDTPGNRAREQALYRRLGNQHDARLEKGEGDSKSCHKTVDVRGGAGMAASRNCSGKVVYTDHLGRGWCRRHEPDKETKERWAKIGEFDAKKKLEKGLPMPKPAIPKRVILPPGTRIDDREKVIHNDGSASWRQMRSGMVLSQDPSGHPTSSRTPSAR